MDVLSPLGSSPLPAPNTARALSIISHIPCHNAPHCVPQYVGMFSERMQAPPGAPVPSPGFIIWYADTHIYIYSIYSSGIPLYVECTWCTHEMYTWSRKHIALFHVIDSSTCPICTNALFWHPELPVHLYLQPLQSTCLSLPYTLTVISAYPSSRVIVAAVSARCVTVSFKSS